MLQNRQNQVAAIQIAARRNLDNALVVAGRAHLPFGPKHRLYGKRLTSTWLPTPVPQVSTVVEPPVVVTGPGIGGMSGYCSRLSSTASMSRMCRYESERQRQMSKQSMDISTLRIPASALAAFAIQRALRG